MNRQIQRRLAVGSNATLVTFLVIAAVVVSYLIVDRFRVRVDLSADQQSVLAKDTRNKLRLLDDAGEPVVITAFTAQRGKKEAYFKDRELEDLVTEIDYASPIVESRFVDFDKERLTAEKLGVTDYGTVVIQRGDQRVDLADRDLFRRVGKGDDRKLEFLGEAAVNRAFSQLMSDTRRVVYALVGHGELDPESRDPDGISDLAKALDQENYDLKRLDLVRDRDDRDKDVAPRVPDDAAAVAILRPRTAIPALEEDLLLAYLATGGSLILAVEPGMPVPGLFGRFGVAVPDGQVLDKLLLFPYPDRPVPRYKNHPITKDLADQALVTVVSRVAPVQASVPPREGVRASTLLETSRDGWIDRGGQIVGGTAVYEPEIDGQGPATMALALELGQDSGLVKRGQARAIVLGDADLFTNSFLSEGPGNVSFAVNCFRWLVGDEGRLSVVGRPTAVRRLSVTAEDLAQLRWMVLLMGPILAVVLGAGVWASRRGR
ncbi:MAG: GldG family protein [Myxococcota bacterium]